MIDSNETLGEKFVKKGLWLYIFAFLMGPVGYFVKILLSQDLSVDGVGILYGVVSLVTLLTVYHDLGMTEALNFFLPKFIVENDYSKFKSVIVYALLVQLPTSIIIGAFLYFGSDFLAAHYFHAAAASGVLKIFSLFFIGSNFYGIVSTAFGAAQDTKWGRGVEFIRNVAILIMTLGFFITKNGSLEHYSWNWNEGLFVGIVVGYTAFYFKYYRKYLIGAKIVFEKPLMKKVFGYALWVLLAANVGMVLSQLDMQLIIYLLGPEPAGYYTNYLSIIGIPFTILSPIIGFLFPVISELHGKGSHEKITTIRGLFYKYFGVLGLIVSGFMFVFAKEFTIILFGDKFAFSGNILMFSIFFIIFNFLNQINFQIMAGVGKIQERVKILGIGLLFNIPLNLILINVFEMYGKGHGVLGSSLAVGISWIPMFYYSHKATNSFSSPFDFGFFIRNGIISAIMSVIMYFFGKPLFLGLDRLQSLILFLILSVLYIMPLVLMNRKEAKLFFGELKKIRRSK